MREVRRLEPRDFDVRTLAKELPQPCPKALGLDHDSRKLTHLRRDLCLVAKVRHEAQLPRRNEQQRAGSRESGEIPDVRQTRYEQAIEMRRGERLHERGDALGATVSHAMLASTSEAPTA